MRIGIDARFYGSRTGIGRYTEQLVHYFQGHQASHDYYIFVRKGVSINAQCPWLHTIEVPYRWYGWGEQLYFPFLLNRYHLHLMHFVHFNVPLLYRRPFIVTIHDLILLRFPSSSASSLHPLYFFIKYMLYQFVVKSAVTRATKIITVSRHTARDIISFFPHITNKIHVIYNGGALHDTSLYPENITVLISGKYFLYVGNCYPHKNLKFLVDQFAQWLQKHPQDQLVLVGKMDFFYRRLERYISTKNYHNIILTGDINDVTLIHLYKHALLFIIPSLYEGFGITALEAMHYGVPVLASRNGSLPEILGTAACYFNTDNPEDFIKQLSHIYANPQYRTKLIRMGLQRVRNFSWYTMAQQTAALYDTVYP